MQSHFTVGESAAAYDMPESNRLLSMQEAMDYLSAKGFPCRSRSTFYRIVEEFGISYTNTNPSGKNEVRRFTKTALDNFLLRVGLTP